MIENFPYIDDFCDDEIYVLSTLGKGPKGDKGDKGDVKFPEFADPITWDPRNDYAVNTIVDYGGNTYISKKDVPHGIDIGNSNYWQFISDYNAQTERIRLTTVRAFDTVVDMQNAIDLKAGMICHTNGFHSVGDGGAAFYQITNIGNENDLDLIGIRNNLIAYLITNNSKYVRIEQLGGLTSTSIAYALSNYKIVECCRSYTVDFPITIPPYKTLIIQSHTYSGNQFAITMMSYSNLKGNGLYSTNIAIKLGINGANVEKFDIDLKEIRCDGDCILLETMNSFGVLDGNIKATVAQSTNENVIHATGAGGFIGQINVLINAMSARNDYAIVLDSSGGASLKGFNFNYSSLEGSKNGLLFDFSGNRCEPIFGYFRLAELNTNTATFFKFVGSVGKLYEISKISFDRCPIRGIDCSGVTYSYPWGYIVLDGRIGGSNGSFCHRGFVYTNRVTLDVPNTISYISGDYKWNAGDRIIKTLVTTGNSGFNITLPAWLGYFSDSFDVVIQEPSRTPIVFKRSDGTTIVDTSTLDLASNDKICFEVCQSTELEQVIWHVVKQSTYPRVY